MGGDGRGWAGKLDEMCVNVVCVCIKGRFGDGMSEAKVKIMLGKFYLDLHSEGGC
jgi:hypothetical protein